MSDFVIELLKFITLLGIILAITISWSIHQSIKWAIIHGMFGWSYVIYYWYYLPL